MTDSSPGKEAFYSVFAGHPWMRQSAEAVDAWKAECERLGGIYESEAGQSFRVPSGLPSPAHLRFTDGFMDYAGLLLVQWADRYACGIGR